MAVGVLLNGPKDALVQTLEPMLNPIMSQLDAFTLLLIKELFYGI